MEFIVEIILEFLVQVVLEAGLELGAQGSGRVVSRRTGRLVSVLIVSLAVGYFAGYFWGVHVADTGRVATPNSVWVGLALAAVSSAAALYASWDPRWDERFESWPELLRLPATRLWTFVALNVAIVVGILVGFGA